MARSHKPLEASLLSHLGATGVGRTKERRSTDTDPTKQRLSIACLVNYSKYLIEWLVMVLEQLTEKAAAELKLSNRKARISAVHTKKGQCW